jgi:lantibiotic biosynthesis protein
VVSAFLDAAARIGERLCAEAIRDGNRCTWMGGSMEPVGGEWVGTRRTFGGDAYAGTSGIALFLGQLHRFAPSEELRATALAALEQALDRAARDATLVPGALYTGAFGIGFAAAEVGAMLDADGVARRGLALVRQHAGAVDPQMFDVVGGTAGRIGGLIRLHRRFGDAWMLDAAVAAGRHLMATADRGPYGWSWGFGTSKYLLRNLTGYSHGAAGVALALLELYAITRDDAFRAAAWEAFRYERSCYSPQQRNWPDFRRTPTQSAMDPLAYGYAWCHGAPGIGMSRLQAFRLAPQEDLRQEALVAMASTRAAIEPLALAGAFGICHGTAGNAELFLQAFEVLGDEASLAFAESLARAGLERFGDGTWPCGLDAAAGEAPGLMVGIAGIGYFFLRLHGRSAVPSILTMGSH